MSHVITYLTNHLFLLNEAFLLPQAFDFAIIKLKNQSLGSDVHV